MYRDLVQILVALLSIDNQLLSIIKVIISMVIIIKIYIVFPSHHDLLYLDLTVYTLI